MQSKFTSFEETLADKRDDRTNWKSKLKRQFNKQTLIEALEDYSLDTKKPLLKKMGKSIIFALKFVRVCTQCYYYAIKLLVIKVYSLDMFI